MIESMKKQEPESDYDRQAREFIEKTGLKIEKTYLGHWPYFEDEKKQRAVYQITFTRGDKSYHFKLGCSIMESYLLRGQNVNLKKKRPMSPTTPLSMNQHLLSARGFKEAVEHGGGFLWADVYLVKDTNNPPKDYDILTSLVKYETGTFADWCADYGYDEDSRKAEKIYFACQKQYSELSRMFTPEELEEMQEIN